MDSHHAVVHFPEVAVVAIFRISPGWLRRGDYYYYLAVVFAAACASMFRGAVAA